MRSRLKKWVLATFNPWISLALFLVFDFTLYASALHMGFLSDDWGYVYLAQHVSLKHSLTYVWSIEPYGNKGGNFRPLTSIIDIFLWRPFVNHPGVLHAISIGLFAIISWLIQRLSFQLFQKRTGALLAGLTFLVLPFNIESVVWLANWNGLISLFFFVLALIVYTHPRLNQRSQA